MEFIFYVYECLICMCVYAPTCVPGTYRGQKRALDPLGLEFQMV